MNNLPSVFYILRFWRALFFTLSTESITILLTRKIFLDQNNKSEPLGLEVKKFFLFGLLPTILTYPYFWFILPLYVKNKLLYVLVGEFSVILVEAVMIKLISPYRFFTTFILSFLANFNSFVIGLILQKQLFHFIQTVVETCSILK